MAGDPDEPADGGIRRSQQHGDADSVLEQNGRAALSGSRRNQEVSGKAAAAGTAAGTQAQQMQIQLQLLAMQNQQRGQQLGAVAANQSNQAPTGA